MAKPIYTAMSGAVARLRQLDQASNNLANMQTAGFRQARLAFDQARASMPSQLLNQPALSMSPRTLPEDTVYANVSRQRLSTRGGTVVATGNPLDLALHGEGFLVLDGSSLALTRDGRLRVDEHGVLRHASGRAVLVSREGAVGPLRVDPRARLSIDARGQVLDGERVLAQLRLVAVQNPGDLRSLGAGLLTAAPGVALAQSNDTTVEAGAIEQSNADPLRSLVELIAAQRGFELAERVIQVAVDLDRKAASDVGQVK